MRPLRLSLLLRVSLGLPALLAVSGASSAVTVDWVTVGDPNNACDVQSQRCFGAVAGTYRISKSETTNSEYAEFLNAMAARGPYGTFDQGGNVLS